MAKKSGLSKHDREMGELLRLGGKKIPPGLTTKASAATKAMLLKRLEVEKGLWMQGARLYSKLKGGSPITVDDPENRETLDAILRLHNKAAGKKLAFPKVAPAFGQLPVAISGTVLPPFEFQSAMPYPFSYGDPVTMGNPIESSTADPNGQISASVMTPDTPGTMETCAGHEFAQVGFYFVPFTPGRLTITASPTYSYEFMTNSLGGSPVGAFGDIELNILPLSEQGQLPIQNPNAQIVFSSTTAGQINWGAQFGVQTSLSASLDVGRFVLYVCFAAVNVGALGSGWPGPSWPGYYGARGSLALGKLSAVVPSISYEFIGTFVR